MTEAAELTDSGFVLLVDSRADPVATCLVSSRYSEIVKEQLFQISLRCQLFPSTDVSVWLDQWQTSELVGKLTALLNNDEPFDFSDAGWRSVETITEFRVYCPQRLAGFFPCTLSFRTKKFDRQGVSSDGSLFREDISCEGAIHHTALLREGAQTLRERLVQELNFRH